MSHLNPLLRLSFVASSALSMAACSASERLVESPPGANVQQSVTTRTGIDGLRQDIAWARSLPRDVTISNSAGANISRDALASTLEADLGALSRTMSSPARSVTSSSRTPSFDYISYGDVGGGLFLWPRPPANGWRLYDVFAYTSCNQNSTVVAALKGTIMDFDWATGAPVASGSIWEQSAVKYVSQNQSVWVRHPSPIRVEGRSTHTCRIGEPYNYPYVPHEAFIVA